LFPRLAARQRVGARHAPPEQLRFFNGYAGWAPGQLARELERGGWLLLNADADTVFRKNMDALWQGLLVRAHALIASLRQHERHRFRSKFLL